MSDATPQSLPPLAERLRPTSLEDYVGQSHLVGAGMPIRDMLDSGVLRSFILWGPPGVGKTTLAHIIAKRLDVPFYQLSAVSAGVKEVREVLSKAESDRKSLFGSGLAPILFIDEIHRFSKSQQDSLLHAVEHGVVTLIGATTENPSFEIIRPLLSRARVFVLKPLDSDELRHLLDQAIRSDEVLRTFDFEVKETDALFAYSGGDARKLLNIIDILSISPEALRTKKVVIDNETVTRELQQNPAVYDKGGEMHYDIISAFIKSIRGSNPDAALYWMARMIEGGEEPEFIARRLIISAAEDIGLANPNALLIANAAFDAVHKIGWPEGRIPLAEAAVYLASSPKSNSAYLAINEALTFVKSNPPYPVPLHLRNASTSLMKDLGYGSDYIYPHDYPGHYYPQEYLPQEIRKTHFWSPQENPGEAKLRANLEGMKRLYEDKNETEQK